MDTGHRCTSNTSRYFSVLIKNVDVRCSLISSRYSFIFEDVDVVPHRLRASMFLLLSWAAPWTVLSNYRLKGYISIRTCIIPYMQAIPQFPNMDADQELRLLVCELSVAERMHLLYHLSTMNLRIVILAFSTTHWYHAYDYYQRFWRSTSCNQHLNYAAMPSIGSQSYSWLKLLLHVRIKWQCHNIIWLMNIYGSSWTNIISKIHISTSMK